MSLGFYSEPTIIPSSDDIEHFYVPPTTKSDTSNLELPPNATDSSEQSQILDSSDIDNMLLSSSPVLYPLSSSPPPAVSKPKRKLFTSTITTIHERLPKKPRTVAGFEVDDEEDEDDIDGQGECDGVTINDSSIETTEKVECISTTTRIGYPDKTTSVENEDSRTWSQDRSFSSVKHSFTSRLNPRTVELQTCSGSRMSIPFRSKAATQTYEETIAQRSITAAGRAKTSYYGIDIHTLMDEARLQKELDEAAVEAEKERQPIPSVERPVSAEGETPKKAHVYQMWTEKYRAKKFTELVGDERTHRSVLRWLKAWDLLVFPGNAKSKPKRVYDDRDHEEKQHRKILLLTGPPGLGKTTLAHVCAKQAGYEVLEINASDDRSRDVVKGRIRDALGTETVRGVQEQGKARKAGRPVCVIVDEVDGVVTGSGGSGEGGFMKALIDLVQLNQKNSSTSSQSKPEKKKGDKFRLMRPLILICNDVYAPSLRPLRQSSLAEIIHVRKPPIDKVITRLKVVFEKENVACDSDAVRRLCESAWGLGTRKQNSLGGRGAGEGDIRGILVQGEWVAHKLRSTLTQESRLTRKWIESHLGESAAEHKGLGRGGVREVVERVFIEGAGLPNLPAKLSNDDARLVKESKSTSIGIADLRKRAAISALQEMINTCGDHDRLMTECLATYPTLTFQDDTLLSKPNAGYDWLHFHDSLSHRVHAGQEWELSKYLSTSACGFHDLFAVVDKGSRGWDNDKAQSEEAAVDVHPFSGLKADFAAHEAQKQSQAVLTELQSNFSASMLRLFSSMDAIATELVPNVARMLAPDVKPVVVGGSGGNASVASVRKDSERNCVRTAVRAMHGLGIEFEKIHIETEGLGAHSNGGYALRMEP